MIVFLIILSEFFFPPFENLLRGSELFLIPPAVFFLLGLILIILTLKQKIKGKLKTFLILTGASATGFFVFVFLHNFFYALGILTEHIIILKYLMEVLHVGFFIIATIICPLGFLISIIATTVLIIKQRKK